MRRLISLVLAAALGVAAVPSGPRPADAAICKTVAVNAKGTGNASITVDATAGGVTVMDASTQRCGATITNSGTADMRCAPSTVTVTSTVGFLIAAGKALNLGSEAQQAWKCIRTTASSTTADVGEANP